MAVVLSLQENIDLLLWLVKLAFGTGAIAIIFLLLFWFRLHKIERRLYHSKSIKSRLVPRIMTQSQVYRQASSPDAPSSHIATIQNKFQSKVQRRSPQTQLQTKIQPQIYRRTPYPKTLKRSARRNRNSRWLLAIAIACITGIAIALLQMNNGLLSPEYTTLIWLCIGVGLVVSAAYVL